MDLMDELYDVDPNDPLAPLCIAAFHEIYRLTERDYFNTRDLNDLNLEIDSLKNAIIDIVYRIGQGDTFGALDIAAKIADSKLNRSS